MDPPEHARYRAPVQALFSQRALAGSKGVIAHLVNESIQQFLSQDEPADLVRHLAVPLPVSIINHLVGVERDRNAQIRDLIWRLQSSNLDQKSVADLSAGLRSLINDAVCAKIGIDDSSVASRLLAGYGGRAFTLDEVVGICVQLIVAGSVTSTSMLSLSVGLIADMPTGDRKAMLDDINVGRTVEELLRYFSVVHYGVTRIVREDTQLADTDLKAGDRLVLSIPLANADSETFGAPDQFNPRRSPNPHLSFGHGIHKCLGMQLARMELRLALTRLFHQAPRLQTAYRDDGTLVEDSGVTFGLKRLLVRWR